MIGLLLTLIIINPFQGKAILANTMWDKGFPPSIEMKNISLYQYKNLFLLLQ